MLLSNLNRELRLTKYIEAAQLYMERVHLPDSTFMQLLELSRFICLTQCTDRDRALNQPTLKSVSVNKDH